MVLQLLFDEWSTLEWEKFETVNFLNTSIKLMIYLKKKKTKTTQTKNVQ